MSQIQNDQNFEEFKNKMTASLGQPYWEAVKEGFEILAKEEKPKTKQVIAPVAKPKNDPKTELKKILTTDQPNPYAKARISVLMDMSPASRNEIVDMEASGNIDHYRYKEFIRRQIEEAEKNT